jgi:hypothetical protein
VDNPNILATFNTQDEDEKKEKQHTINIKR